MPTFKHPCPYCGKLIDKVVRACPYCGQDDPFAPKRCQNCHKIVDDPTWVVCPSCGQSLIAPPPVAAGTAGAGTAGAGAGAGSGQPAAAAGAQPQPAAGGAAPIAPPPPRPPLYQDRAAPAPAVQSAGPCSGCGAPLPAGARFCTICGTMAG
jgi:RNA polymerase subunit RPABC4/transcription elongation factor Spt4